MKAYLKGRKSRENKFKFNEKRSMSLVAAATIDILLCSLISAPQSEQLLKKKS
jgi:hypothetical protein